MEVDLVPFLRDVFPFSSEGAPETRHISERLSRFQARPRSFNFSTSDHVGRSSTDLRSGKDRSKCSWPSVRVSVVDPYFGGRKSSPTKISATSARSQMT
ncbi:hypothetical protein J6590_068307 [Homalodisca vitripennis]|nr:hypothetical protein J6590_068307 [Homalodisca vitripennis]